MATYAETISRICDDLSRPDEEIGTIVGREILSAIEYYDGWRFAFNERVLEVTLSATNTYQYSYLVSGDTQLQALMQIDEVKVTNSGHEYLVERVPWGEFQRLDKDASSTTIPDYWSVYNQRLFLWPTPNADLPAKITAHVKFVAINGSTVVENAWLNQGEELIRSRTCKMVCMRKLDNYEKGQVFAQLEADALRGLLKESNTKHQSGILAPND